MTEKEKHNDKKCRFRGKTKQTGELIGREMSVVSVSRAARALWLSRPQLAIRASSRLKKTGVWRFSEAFFHFQSQGLIISFVTGENIFYK